MNHIETKSDLNEDYVYTCNTILSEMQKYTSINDFICYDSIPLEYLITAIINNDVSDDILRQLFEISLKSLNYIDAIFIIPKSKYNIIDENEDIDVNVINNFGLIYDSIIHAYGYGDPTPFFNINNCPGFIDIFGNDEQKLQLFEYYLKPDGTLQDDNLQQSLSPKQLQESEELLKSAINEQKQKIKKEAFYKQLKRYK